MAQQGKAGERVMDYDTFLKSKYVTDKSTGFCPGPLNPMLFDFQAAIVRWACKRGRAAIFADCGLGKTPIQLEWAKQAPCNVLILAPLAVTGQTLREAKKFGISDISHVRSGEEVKSRITITNYEALHKFDLTKFEAIVLDESSILKSYMGKTKMLLLDAFKDYPYRLCCTATPAPNDHMELGNHSAFLGVMPSNEMISRWFINDSMHAGNYRLKDHGRRDYWRWVSSWAVSLRKPSDMGNYPDDAFILPELKITTKTVDAVPPDGYLFNVGSTLSATEIHQVKRKSAKDRAQAAAAFASASDAQCLIWCDTNYEADEVMRCLPDAIDVRGDHPETQKERSLLGFASGEFKVLVTKPSIAGFGMNFQQCHRVVFIGLSYSFESLYQALRRVYRFGQSQAVEAVIIESDAETGIRAAISRKIEQHEEMQDEMCESMKEFQTIKRRELIPLPTPKKQDGSGWELWNGDCVDVARNYIKDESVDFSIFSPPFANLYIYSDNIADMGNCANSGEFFGQMDFLIKQLYRITVNGRLCAVHCKDLPAYMGRDGSAGLKDFPGELIRAFEKNGWQYHSRVTIWKDPVTEMQRTKNHGLLHKQLCKDSSASRMGMADYLIAFRKWDGIIFPKPVHGPSNIIRFTDYIGEEGPQDARSNRDYSIQVWQRYASPVWFDIRQQRVLQGSKHATCEEDEKHICPLQLDVIERAIHLWTNPADVVFSPFAGIGSEGYCAVKMQRRFIGIELKESYWRQAIKNMELLEAQEKQASLL